MANTYVKDLEIFIKNRIGQLKNIKDTTDDLMELPRFYSNNFNLYRAKLSLGDKKPDFHIKIIEMRNKNLTDINILKKQIVKILEVSKEDSSKKNGYILLVPELENALQRLMIKNNIPFYTVKNQSLFLPFLYLELHSNLEVLKKFTPSEQIIICYLMKNIGKDITQKKLEFKLGVSKSVVQKTLKKLEQLSILKRVGYTRNVSYQFIKDQDEIFKIVKAYLISPIRKKVFIENNKDTSLIIKKYIKNGVLSSETALSELSLYDAGNIHHYALEKNNYRDLEEVLANNNILTYSKKEAHFLSQHNPIFSFEQWSYSPLLIKDRKNTIDIISLYKVLEDDLIADEDYRLSQELEKVLEGDLSAY